MIRTYVVKPSSRGEKRDVADNLLQEMGHDRSKTEMK